MVRRVIFLWPVFVKFFARRQILSDRFLRPAYNKILRERLICLRFFGAAVICIPVKWKVFSRP